MSAGILMSQVAPVLFGNGCIDQVGIKAKEFKCQKVLVVCDEVMVKTGAADKVINYLKASDIEVALFDKVTPDPASEMVDEAGNMARKEKVDGIVGIGGGSTIDTCKALNVLINNPGSIENYLNFEPFLPGVPVIVLPTTSGTGADISGGAMVTSKSGVKKAIMSTTSFSILDPELTLTVPPSVTLSTGYDVFAHAAEAITTKMYSPKSQLFAEFAIEKVLKYLPIAMADGENLEARENLALASNFAGMAMSETGTHLGHSSAHAIATVYHLPHGVLLASTLPVAIKRVANAVPEKVRRLAEVMGLELNAGLSPEEVAEAIAQAIYAFNRKLGVKSLKDNGIAREALVGRTDIAQVMKNDITYFFSPVDDTLEGYAEMITSMYDNYQ